MRFVDSAELAESREVAGESGLKVRPPLNAFSKSCLFAPLTVQYLSQVFLQTFAILDDSACPVPQFLHEWGIVLFNGCYRISRQFRYIVRACSLYQHVRRERIAEAVRVHIRDDSRRAEGTVRLFPLLRYERL